MIDPTGIGVANVSSRTSCTAAPNPVRRCRPSAPTDRGQPNSGLQTQWSKPRTRAPAVHARHLSGLLFQYARHPPAVRDENQKMR